MASWAGAVVGVVLAVAAGLALLSPRVAGADAGPVVSNVSFAQRAGTRLVDITYDVADADSPELLVEVTVLVDGVPITTSRLTGDIGPRVVPGTGKHVVWDAGGDWPNRSDQIRVKVRASGTDYLVIDVSAGPSASSYPVSHLDAVPTGGWTDEYKTTKIVLRRIPAGTFAMGSPEGEIGRVAEYETLHQVTQTRDFCIGVFELTQRQWLNVMGGANPSAYPGDTRPVEQVSYDDLRGSLAGRGWPADNAVDATSFMGTLRARTGLSFDLPTESQWEFACRAGTTRAYNDQTRNGGTGADCLAADASPSANLEPLAWYSANCIAAGKQHQNVGGRQANAWGLFDMHGNVWECCLDWRVPYSGLAERDPVGAATGSYRVTRGGSWTNDAWICRAAWRDGGRLSNGDAAVGVRICLPTNDYLVVDVSGGPSASSYPVSHLGAVPADLLTNDAWATSKVLLRRIPAGTFTMGSPESEPGRYPHETQHQVTLTRDFYLGVFAVTQRQWLNVMGGSNPSAYPGDKRPVEMVSWDDIRGGTWPGDPVGSGGPAAGTFMDKLRSKTGGLAFDLPTESQWEYACRAGTTRAYNDHTKNGGQGADCLTGGNAADANLEPLAWYYANAYVLGGKHRNVGGKQANAWGLYDMHGNVWEWVLDWLDTYPGAAVDPAGAATGSSRVERGGSWGNEAFFCRSAFRTQTFAANRNDVSGFRPAVFPADP